MVVARRASLDAPGFYIHRSTNPRAAATLSFSSEAKAASLEECRKCSSQPPIHNPGHSPTECAGHADGRPDARPPSPGQL